MIWSGVTKLTLTLGYLYVTRYTLHSTQCSENDTDKGDEDWLKSTGKKRSLQLALGKYKSSEKIENSNEKTKDRVHSKSKNQNKITESKVIMIGPGVMLIILGS